MQTLSTVLTTLFIFGLSLSPRSATAEEVQTLDCQTADSYTYIRPKAVNVSDQHIWSIDEDRLIVHERIGLSVLCTVTIGHHYLPNTAVIGTHFFAWGSDRIKVFTYANGQVQMRNLPREYIAVAEANNEGRGMRNRPIILHYTSRQIDVEPDGYLVKLYASEFSLNEQFELNLSHTSLIDVKDWSMFDKWPIPHVYSREGTGRIYYQSERFNSTYVINYIQTGEEYILSRNSFTVRNQPNSPIGTSNGYLLTGNTVFDFLGNAHHILEYDRHSTSRVAGVTGYEWPGFLFVACVSPTGCYRFTLYHLQFEDMVDYSYNPIVEDVDDIAFHYSSSHYSFYYAAAGAEIQSSSL